MRAIIPDVLWIGHAGDARDLKKIMEMGIELLLTWLSKNRRSYCLATLRIVDFRFMMEMVTLRRC